MAMKLSCFEFVDHTAFGSLKNAFVLKFQKGINWACLQHNSCVTLKRWNSLFVPLTCSISKFLSLEKSEPFCFLSSFFSLSFYLLSSPLSILKPFSFLKYLNQICILYYISQMTAIIT